VNTEVIIDGGSSVGFPCMRVWSRMDPDLQDVMSIIETSMYGRFERLINELSVIENGTREFLHLDLKKGCRMKRIR
jgi:hypothetical protein